MITETNSPTDKEQATLAPATLLGDIELKAKEMMAADWLRLVRENQKLRAALKPFVDVFNRQMDKSGKNSPTRQAWNKEMPDSFPISIAVTMGDCRTAVDLSPNDQS